MGHRLALKAKRTRKGMGIETSTFRMTRQTEFVLVMLVVALVAFAGALASKYVHHGGHWLVYYIPGMLSIGTWAWVARRSPYTLLTSSMVWDVVYNGVWVIAVVLTAREGNSTMQIIGACVITVGLVLMGL